MGTRPKQRTCMHAIHRQIMIFIITRIHLLEKERPCPVNCFLLLRFPQLLEQAAKQLAWRSSMIPTLMQKLVLHIDDSDHFLVLLIPSTQKHYRLTLPNILVWMFCVTQLKAIPLCL